MKYSELLQFCKRQWAILLVLIVALAFFFFTSSFNFLSQDKHFVKWLSPDETANYTVAKIYAETGSLQFFEKYNLIADDLIHPRSFRSDWGWVKPVSFLGVPLAYGFIARFFGSAVLPYLSPFFGALGILLIYLLIKELFGKKNALVSSLLLAVFPVYTYFSARSFFHNIFFIVATIGGLYFAVLMGKKKIAHDGKSYLKREWKELLFALASGLCFGWAISARSSELLWLGPLLVGLYLFNFRRLGLIKPWVFAYGMLIALFPLLYWNQTLYGIWYASGYPELNSSLATLSENGSALAQKAATGNLFSLQPLLAKIKMTIFHFGYKPEHSRAMFHAYVYAMFPWLIWLATAGVALFIAQAKKYERKRWLFLIGWVCVSAVLILYYGSWVFYDNPDPKSFTIGNSYTRYWLPLYLGALPFVSLCVLTLASFFKRQRFSIPLVTAAVVCIATISISFVWNDPSEGLAASLAKQRSAKIELNEVVKRTENNAVIITRYHDKLLFPQRKVVIGLFNDKNMIAIYARIAQYVPLYYYNFSYSDKDLEYLNNGPLQEAGLRMEAISAITDRFTLYRLNVVKADMK